MSDGTPVCVEIITAIAKVEGTDSANLGFELHDHIHTDALEFLASDGKGPMGIKIRGTGARDYREKRSNGSR